MRFIYFDTETTGIKPQQDRIIEIAAYDPERGTTFEMLVNPGIPIPKEATAVHNISDEMVADAEDFGVVGDAFLNFCDGDAVLVAHNGDSFDIPFLYEEYKRFDRPLPRFESLDTLKWARKYRPDLPRHTLQFLREIYGIPANNAHRALDDVIVLHKLFSLMIDDLTPEAVMQLIKTKGKPKTITHMPFGKHKGEPLSKVPRSYLSWLAGSGALDKPDNEELKESLEKLGLLDDATAPKQEQFI